MELRPDAATMDEIVDRVKASLLDKVCSGGEKAARHG